MARLLPNDRPLRRQLDASKATRRLTAGLIGSLVGLVVSLVVTVAWTPGAGWVFLALLFLSSVIWVVRGVVQNRAAPQTFSETLPFRFARRTRVWKLLVDVAIGILAALAASRLTDFHLILVPSFVVAAVIADAVISSVLTAGLVQLLPEDIRSAQRLDIALNAARVALEGAVPGSDGWENTLERCRRSVYDEALRLSLEGVAANARVVTWRREPTPDRPPQFEAAWEDVIEAARKGIAAGESA